MQVILLIIIGVFLMYRMMRVEDRMNKIEHDIEKSKSEIKKVSVKKDKEFNQFHT